MDVQPELLLRPRLVAEHGIPRNSRDFPIRGGIQAPLSQGLKLRVEVRDANPAEAAHLVDRLLDPRHGGLAAQGLDLGPGPADEPLSTPEVPERVLPEELVEEGMERETHKPGL